MTNNILATWQANTQSAYTTTVVPDGCRDLIMKTVGTDKPEWFVTSLFDQSESVYVENHCRLVGFRLRPGIEINVPGLIAYMESKEINTDEVPDILDDFVSLDSSVEEALACLASEVTSVKQASVQLGVSTRTLQRLLLNKTARNPGYWFQLARVRKAAKCLSADASFADVAEMVGFSDQPHMNREFKRWFGFTPTALVKSPELIRQVNAQAYA